MCLHLRLDQKATEANGKTHLQSRCEMLLLLRVENSDLEAFYTEENDSLGCKTGGQQALCVLNSCDYFEICLSLSKAHKPVWPKYCIHHSAFNSGKIPVRIKRSFIWLRTGQYLSRSSELIHSANKGLYPIYYPQSNT